jgi:hypothetical protein
MGAPPVGSPPGIHKKDPPGGSPWGPPRGMTSPHRSAREKRTRTALRVVVGGGGRRKEGEGGGGRRRRRRRRQGPADGPATEGTRAGQVSVSLCFIGSS